MIGNTALGKMTVGQELAKITGMRNLEQMIGDLTRILDESEPSDALRGFCYWNLSDCYAMRRRSREEYKNYRRFYEFVKNFPTQYRFWCVCNATQRLSLEIGGYGAFWWELYRDAVAQNSQYAENFVFSIDKNQSDTIDTGDRTVKIYPDKPEEIENGMHAAGLQITAQWETEFALLYSIVKQTR